MPEARSLLPTPPRRLYQPPPTFSPSLTSAQHTAMEVGGLPPLGGQKEFSFQRKCKELPSPRASLVPSLWVLRKISGGNSSVHPHLSPETPAGHTLPLRSRSRSRSRTLADTPADTHAPSPHASPGDAEGPVALQFLCTWGEGEAVGGIFPGGVGRSGPPSPDLRASCPTCQGPGLPASWEASQGSWGLGVGVRRKRGSGENSLSPSLLHCP